jgi:hypothetical protein
MWTRKGKSHTVSRHKECQRGEDPVHENYLPNEDKKEYFFLGKEGSFVKSAYQWLSRCSSNSAAPPQEIALEKKVPLGAAG